MPMLGVRGVREGVRGGVWGVGVSRFSSDIQRLRVSQALQPDSMQTAGARKCSFTVLPELEFDSK